MRAGRTGAPGRAVVAEARAKLNLGLAVGPRRPDGFHDLATIFQSISLADTLRVEPRRSGFTLELRHESAAIRGRAAVRRLDRIPSGAGNLVLRAARAFAARTGLEGGAHFRLVKRIPVGSGLGGGSADAAAALAALRALYRLRIDRQDMLALAKTLGSDVPFALLGGTAVGLGRGENLRKVSPIRPFRAIVAVPSWRVSTVDAYRRWDRSKYPLTLWSAKLRFSQSVGRKRIRLEQALSLGNSFEAVLGPRQEDFESVRARLLEAGCRRPLLTGSGSAVFGIIEAGEVAARVVTRFQGNETLFFVRSARAGVRLRSF